MREREFAAMDRVLDQIISERYEEVSGSMAQHRATGDLAGYAETRKTKARLTQMVRQADTVKSRA